MPNISQADVQKEDFSDCNSLYNMPNILACKNKMGHNLQQKVGPPSLENWNFLD